MSLKAKVELFKVSSWLLQDWANIPCSVMHRHSSQQLFVPPALSSLRIEPEDCQLVARYSETANRTRFTYSISWTSGKTSAKISKDEEDDALLLSILAPVDEASQYLSDLREARKRRPSAKLIRCDGPCGHRYPPESMILLGRCGHMLCNVCNGLVYNDDGTKGCSNFDCVFATLYDYLPEDYARKAYENHIIARQKARESALHYGFETPPRKARSPMCGTPCRRKQGMKCLHPCPRGGRSHGRRSRTPRYIRARKSRSSSRLEADLRTAIGDENYQRSRSSYARSPISEPSIRRRRVLDEIFSDMTLTSSNVEGPTSEFELLNIRLMIFEPGPFKTIKRVHISREMSAALTVKEAIDELMDRRNGNIRHECPSSLYFCSGTTADGLRKISVEEFEATHLWQYPARNSVLHFVLDTVGYLRGTD
ncbi:unnamed protein product [Cylicocyclus nassatus]|uniref:Uncharacterized protein n=1 Tax=Cylicocyclus nassatus TaxID=53992 RepID=A0AA36GJS2_CYLNA|nr:unnamed protein product [Cylicocyclus nassatus]